MSGCTKISELLNSYFVSVFSEEEGGDLLKSGFSFPGTPEEELGTDTISQIPCTACTRRGWGCSGGVRRQEAARWHSPSPATKPSPGMAPGAVPESGQKPLSPALLGVSHLLHKARELKAEKHQIWVTSRQPRIQKKVFKEIINFPSFVFFFLSCPLENVIIAERVSNVTF